MDTDHIDVSDKEDALMSLFFSNVHQCLFKQWESFVKEQSAKFR